MAIVARLKWLSGCIGGWERTGKSARVRRAAGCFKRARPGCITHAQTRSPRAQPQFSTLAMTLQLCRHRVQKRRNALAPALGFAHPPLPKKHLDPGHSPTSLRRVMNVIGPRLPDCGAVVRTKCCPVACTRSIDIPGPRALASSTHCENLRARSFAVDICSQIISQPANAMAVMAAS